MPSTDVDKEAVRVAAIARVLAECFGEAERIELVTEALKPLFADTKDNYGGVRPSIFKKAIEGALKDWARQEVMKYCRRPGVRGRLKEQFEKECAQIIQERISKWAGNMIRQPD